MTTVSAVGAVQASARDRESLELGPSALQRVHYQLQSGCFISKVEEGNGGLHLFSAVTPAPIWNHSVWLGGKQNRFELFLDECRNFLHRFDRRPAIYLTDPSAEEIGLLKENSFRSFDREAWMVLTNPRGARSARVHEISDAKGFQEFVELFTAVFGADGSSYQQALKQRPEVSHFILFDGAEPASIGTLHRQGPLGSIYNVGTVTRARGRGFAGELLQHMLASAAAAGCERLFLQVEEGSAAERLYLQAGFSLGFLRLGFLGTGLPEWERNARHFPELSSRGRSQSGEIRYEHETKPLPDDLAARLLATFRSVSLNSVFAAAWAYVLHRYSGRGSVGFSVHGGNGKDARSLSVEPSRNMSVREWVEHCERAQQVGAAERGFESAVVFNSTNATRPVLSYPIEVHFTRDLPEAVGIFFRADLVDKDRIRRMGAHFVNVLGSILTNAAGHVADLEILSEREKHQLLVLWNQSTFSGGQLAISKLFEDQVERNPDSVALAFAQSGSDEPTEQLTYRQVNRRANRLAHRLQDSGIGPGVAVGVLLDRSLNSIISLLAVFKAGGLYVPLDPATPPDRLAFIVNDVAAQVLITSRELVARLNLSRAVSLLVLEDSYELLHNSDKNPLRSASVESAAYVIYTSGSTGKPKGVVVSHYAFANHVMDCVKTYGLSSKDRVLQFSPLSFDASLEQILSTLTAGASLIVREEEVWNPREFSEKLRQCQITVVDLPTAYWHQLVDYWSEHSVSPYALRLCIVGGEAISAEAVKRWKRTAFGRVRLTNAYGPTEAVITATSYDFDTAEDKMVASLIGRPRGGRKAYVLDGWGRPVPIGVEGELYLGGALLARGYHNQPKLTAERFVTDPFTDDPKARLYKTGDLVRYREDGNLEFLGRMDDQVKIRGFRIELGEIESVLRRDSRVRDALVLAKARAERDHSLVAYVVASESRVIAADLRKLLLRALPSYMVPSSIIALEKWPLLPNGKIDRRALPDPVALAQETAVVCGPREPLELQLQLIFERVLKISPVGINQSFFQLGGDSLQALDLLVQIEKGTGKQLPLGTLYQASTVEMLAREVRTRVAPEGWSSLVPLQAGGIRPPLFLLHTTPGDILGYGNLVYRLGPDQPCYGFQSLGLKDKHLSHTSIEEMARYYVDLLRRFQAHGPYFLGGWCYGGVLAVEMARLLKAQGEAIGLLALLETVAIPASLRNYRYYLHRANCLLRMSPARWFLYAREKIRYTRQSRVANRMRFRQVDGDGRSRDPRLAQLERVYNTNLAALNRFRSRYYDGTITLFNAAEQDPASIPDRYYGWRGLARQIEIREVPGNHDSMLAEPNVSILAQQLNDCLHEAQAKHPSHDPAGN